MAGQRPEVAILGGSFNPVHNGHVRLAVEILELFRPARLDVLPCGTAPHKPGRGMLPFALRFELALAAFQGIDSIRVSPLEGERQGPSYTVDTLARYLESEPELRPLFIMGSTDFLTLPQWHDGAMVPELADLVLVPRLDRDREAEQLFIDSHWGPEVPAGQRFGRLLCDGGLQRDGRGLDYWTVRTPENSREHRIYHADMPRFDVSASLVREKWLKGGMLKGLVPMAVESLLAEHADEVREAWASA